MQPDCSIVIPHTDPKNTLPLLQNLQWLDYDGALEVIVVSPFWDTLPAGLAALREQVTVCHAPGAATASRLRNVGLEAARADHVAFVDAGAVVGSRWLTELLAGFSHAGVACVSGPVIEGSEGQRRRLCNTVDRLGNKKRVPASRQGDYNFPFSHEIVLGNFQNIAFQKNLLTSVRSFDPNLSEALALADVCFRLVDAGYEISLPDAAPVFVAPGNAPGPDSRQEATEKIDAKLRFSFRHAKDHYTDAAITADAIRYAAQVLKPYASKNGLFYSQQDCERIVLDRQRSLQEGTASERSSSGRNATIKRALSPFPRAISDTPQVLVLVSRDYPPNHHGGVATFNKDLAEALARDGQIVHVVTQTKDTEHVSFEHGVWIHKIAVETVRQSLRVKLRNIPQHLWDWSACAYREVCRLAQWESISCIEAPIWDCEGIAFLMGHTWPLVTSLQTTLHFWLESNPRFRRDKRWMRDIGRPTLDTEKKLMLGSDAIRSISRAIKTDLETAYDLRFDPRKIQIHPLGIRPHDVACPAPLPSETVDVLFVGRLETRKGIDILFQAMEQVLAVNDTIRFTIIGNDTIVSDDGVMTYKERFLQSRCWQRWSSNIVFLGLADNETLRAAYQACDIFVAPSRFESFGLVFLEAMEFGKPVIGSDVGGIPEIIEHEKTGLLVDVGNAAQLGQAILRLAANEPLRQELGRRGKQLFEAKFTAASMARHSLPLYALAQENFRRS
jgi:glycosyltransferase involved in cell wall biosynthesis